MSSNIGSSLLLKSSVYNASKALSMEAYIQPSAFTWW